MKSLITLLIQSLINKLNKRFSEIYKVAEFNKLYLKKSGGHQPKYVHDNLRNIDR